MLIELLACILLYVLAVACLSIFLIILIFALKDEEWGSPIPTLLIAFGLFSLVFTAVAIYKNVTGLKAYEKRYNIYSLKTTDDYFILGIGKEFYYFDLAEEENNLKIKKIGIRRSELIYQEIENPYILEYKKAWEDTHYEIYLPENIKIIQYSEK